MFIVISLREERICQDELDEQDMMVQSQWNGLSKKLIKGDVVYTNFSSAPSICYCDKNVYLL